MAKKKNKGSNYQLKRKRKEEGHDTSEPPRRSRRGRYLARAALEGAGPGNNNTPIAGSRKQFFNPSEKEFKRQPFLEFSLGSIDSLDTKVVFDNGHLQSIGYCDQISQMEYILKEGPQFSFDQKGKFTESTMPAQLVKYLFLRKIIENNSEEIDPSWLHVEKDRTNPIETLWYLRPGIEPLDTVKDKFRIHPEPEVIRRLNEKVEEFNNNKFFNNEIYRRIQLRDVKPSDLKLFYTQRNQLGNISRERKELETEIIYAKAKINRRNSIPHTHYNSWF